MAKKVKSALLEKDGVHQPPTVSSDGAARIIDRRQKAISAKDLIKGIFSGDISFLSRAITLVESANSEHQKIASEIISACLPKSSNSIRIGITGVPGVGKSTFIEAFGKYLTGIGKKVAVLAVDPSSTISHGSILGDKTRMEELVKDQNAYIRPSASGETLGGVAAKTRESITLCEAFGFDVIIIETVGVGQSETAVHSMVDFFLLLKISGAGDELQGIKRGIMEMADAVVINKADGDNIKKAKLAKTEFARALHLFPAKSSGWIPKVTTCSSITKEGIEDVWKIVQEFIQSMKLNGYFESKRKDQDHDWMIEMINYRITSRFYNSFPRSSLDEMKRKISNRELSPMAAAQALLDRYFKEGN